MDPLAHECDTTQGALEPPADLRAQGAPAFRELCGHLLIGYESSIYFLLPAVGGGWEEGEFMVRGWPAGPSGAYRDGILLLRGAAEGLGDAKLESDQETQLKRVAGEVELRFP
jgi:hypothetical protein